MDQIRPPGPLVPIAGAGLAKFAPKLFNAARSALSVLANPVRAALVELSRPVMAIAEGSMQLVRAGVEDLMSVGRGIRSEAAAADLGSGLVPVTEAAQRGALSAKEFEQVFGATRGATRAEELAQAARSGNLERLELATREVQTPVRIP